MKFFYYKDKTGLWKWYLKNRNDEKIAESSDGYWNKQDCLRTIELVRQTSKYTTLVNLEGETAPKAPAADKRESGKEGTVRTANPDE